MTTLTLTQYRRFDIDIAVSSPHSAFDQPPMEYWAGARQATLGDASLGNYNGASAEQENKLRKHIKGIDHAVIATRDLDTTQDTFRRMGFTLTPRGRHTLGSGN